MPEDDNGARGRFVEALKRFDAHPRLIRAAQAARGMLPGDKSYGDPLSVAGNEPPQLIGQRLTTLTNDRPSAIRELGLSTLQVWQALSEAQGRGRGDRELAILFTDLVGVSSGHSRPATRTLSSCRGAWARPASRACLRTTAR